MTDASWVMHQRWTNVLFAHWPVSPSALRPLLPKSLELLTYDGEAWIGVVPFLMSNVRPRGLPPLPWLSSFPELNVRTYVRHGEQEGVWFFSLDASQPIAVRAARRFVHLPYYDARMRIASTGKGEIRYESARTHRGARPANFAATYRPDGEVRPAAPGTIEHFLVERYLLFAAAPRGLITLRIAHRPWPLQRAIASIDRNTMGHAIRVPLEGEPRFLHFGRRVDVRTWWPASV
ncbi:MAG: YqjF family protein [Gemmatimonadaceae bacterium]